MIFVMVLGVITVFALFALSICWAANEVETMKGEKDYPDEQPMLKVVVLDIEEEDDDDNKTDDI